VEVIVHRPQKRDFKCPVPTCNISRKSHIIVLGVVIGSNLKFDKHVENFLQVTYETLFALEFCVHMVCLFCTCWKGYICSTSNVCLISLVGICQRF